MHKFKLLFLTVSLLFSLVTKSQEEIPFKIRYKEYIKGDITFIANNIVNKSNNPNEAYNKINNSAKLNDELEMGYIDIDNDKSTFSSSSATLKNDLNKEIVFAGLYWAANYKYEVGISKQNETIIPDRTENFNEIKIKTPSNNSYQKITGKVIFDGYNTSNYKHTSPYVCFSDITNLVKNNPFGEYTVANIKATQGFIDGGVSGGWIIYFVYKNEVEKPKYISIYDGFAHIYNKPIDIHLSDFLTPKTGQINPKITFCALEGDFSISGDNVRLKNLKNNKYFHISSLNRTSQNFFKSFITIDENHFLDRNPASLNTLGFDAVLQTIDNKKNLIIENNTDAAEMKISSSGDKFFLFSTGFSIDVDEVFFEDKIKNKTSSENHIAITEHKKGIAQEVNAQITEQEQIQKNKTKKTTDVKIRITELPSIANENSDEIVDTTAIKQNSDSNEIKLFEQSENAAFMLKKDPVTERKPREIRKITVDTNLKHGFYLICNVFAVPNNANNYMLFLKRNKIKSGYFTNPENSYRYVFLSYYKTKEEAEIAYYSNFDNTFFDDYWILEVDK